MQLQVIGPERDHGGDRRARGHEREVRARQLEEEHGRRARRLIGTRAGRGGRRWARGCRRARRDSPPARCPRCRRISAVNAVVEVLPAVPVMPMLGPRQRSSSRSPRHETLRSLRAEALHPRRDLGRPDVEVGDVGIARIGVEVGFRLDARHRAPRSARASAARRRGLARRTRAPFRCEQPRERDLVGPEALDQDVHCGDHRGSASFSRTYARRTATALGSRAQAASAGRRARSRGGAAEARSSRAAVRKLLHSQSSARSTKPCRTAFRRV